MTEFEGVSEQIKESLIEEYLQKNPGVDRSQVVSRLGSGKIVLDTIGNVLASVSGRKAREDEREFLEKQFRINEDDRYQACRKSMENCKELVNYLSGSRVGGMSLDEKEKQLWFLKRQDRTIVNVTCEVHDIKAEILDMIGGKAYTSSSRVRSLTKNYLRAVLDQLKCQHTIYEREHSVGTEFTTSAFKFIEENVPSVRGSLKPAIRKRIVQAFKLAKKASGQDAPAVPEPTREALEAALSEMEAELDVRRTQIQAIQKVIAVLEALLEKIGERGGGPSRESDSKARDAGGDKKKSSGMAFITKLFGR